MPHFSTHQEIVSDILANTFEDIAKAAGTITNEADKKSMVFAKRAVQMAGFWVKDTTEASRRECAKSAALLKDNATNGNHSKLNNVLLILSHALTHYLACEYRAASKTLVSANDLLKAQ